MMTAKKIPQVLGFCAYSGTGKTTLLLQLIPILNAKGIRIGVIKHAHRKFDIDRPGKDSYELRKAGAEQILISSSRRHALITELAETDAEPTLPKLIRKLDLAALDLILVEGFKHGRFPKIELHRCTLGKPYIYPMDNGVIALADDGTPPADLMIHALNLNDIAGIAEFIIAYTTKKLKMTGPQHANEIFP